MSKQPSLSSSKIIGAIISNNDGRDSERLCAQEITLDEAQHAMATNWIEAWKQYVPSHQHYRFKRVD